MSDPVQDPVVALAPIDPTLLEQLEYVKQLINVHDLLNNGMFPGGVSKRVALARDFVQVVHADVLAKCEQHPDFDRAQAEEKAKAMAAQGLQS